MACIAGRDRKKEVFWWRVMGAQPRRGMSIRAWCREHALRESSFYWWRRQLALRDEAPRATTLVPVRVVAELDGDRRDDGDERDDGGGAGGASRLEIVFPDALCVRVVGPVDRRALTDVLAAMTSTRGDPVRISTGAAATLTSTGAAAPLASTRVAATEGAAC
ncbi:MAG: hypothetical protein IT449_00020 [Phycisphaerales bacterium]|nr:hypothetical protein [Phycisphaerales bacterium]